MKVNNTNHTTVKPTNSSAVRGADTKTARSKENAGEPSIAEALDSAKIQMSKDALGMQKAKAIAGKDTVDEAKVARLQKLIDEGKYKVDAAAVSDRLVNEHLMMDE